MILKSKADYWGFIGLIVILSFNSLLILLGFLGGDQSFSIPRDTYVLSGLLVVEIILYWLMRHHIYKRLWVKAHVILFALGFIVLPFLIHFIGLSTLSPDATDIEYAERIIFLAKADVVTIYSCLIIAHIFFALTLIKSFGFKKELNNNNNEPPGLLDEFVK